MSRGGRYDENIISRYLKTFLLCMIYIITIYSTAKASTVKLYYLFYYLIIVYIIFIYRIYFIFLIKNKETKQNYNASNKF